MNSDDRLHERLFGLEPLSSDRRQQFHNELATIVEPRLSRGQRQYYVAGLAGCLVGLPGAVCGLLLDSEHRWVWALNLVVLLGLAAWILSILRRGAEPLSAMQTLSKAFVAVALFTAGVPIVWGIETPSLDKILWSLLGLLMFLLMSFINLWNRLLTAERTVREQLLRIEYRLALIDASNQRNEPVGPRPFDK